MNLSGLESRRPTPARYTPLARRPARRHALGVVALWLSGCVPSSTAPPVDAPGADATRDAVPPGADATPDLGPADTGVGSDAPVPVDAAPPDAPGPPPPTDGGTAPTVTVQWAHRFGGGGYDGTSDVLVDPSGDVIMTGTFLGRADFGAGFVEGGAAYNQVVARYSSRGALLWERHFAGESVIAPPGGGVLPTHPLGRDARGNIYLATEYRGTTDPGGTTLTSRGVTDLLLVSFAPDGALRWAHSYGTSAAEWVTAMAVDADGNVFLTGHSNGDVDLGGGPIPAGVISSAYRESYFFASFDPDGGFRWAHALHDAAYGALVHGLVTDRAGSVYTVGTLTGTLAFGAGTLTARGASDIALLSFDTAGAPRWARQYGGAAAAEDATLLAIDGADRLVILGHYAGTTDLGGGALTASGSGGVLLGVTSDGTYRFARNLEDPWGNLADVRQNGSIALDQSGRIFVGATVPNPTDHGYGTGTPAPSGGEDIALEALDSVGTPRWSRRFSSILLDRVAAVAAGPDGYYVAGTSAANIDFGVGPLRPYNIDMLLFKLEP